jgi:hypothetical protein
MVSLIIIIYNCNMFIAQATNCDITYDHHLQLQYGNSTGQKIVKSLTNIIYNCNMFVAQATNCDIA